MNRRRNGVADRVTMFLSHPGDVSAEQMSMRGRAIENGVPGGVARSQP